MICFDQFAQDSSSPIYLQIIGFIKRGIVAGTITDGDEMPSRRTLSALLGVNPNTVQKSYAILEEEGLILSRSGAKSCVSVNKESIHKLRQELLGDSLRAVAKDMKQMGMTQEDALAALSYYWEVEP